MKINHAERRTSNAKRFFRLMLPALLVLTMASPSAAQEPFIDHYGLSAGFSSNFHPSTRVQMWFLTPYVSHDFGNHWQGRLEAFLGMTQIPEQRAALGLTPLAAYDLKAFSLPQWFVEGGVGLFYTDIRVPGFGSNWVFSPQIGLGRNFQIDANHAFQVKLRYHHLSNAYLSSNNTSIDSLMILVGIDFGK
jgi:lipid A 3-O-deacylase